MNKSCARCNKTVYPVEELKCLDKVWHKACFKCEACGMTLNMRNYKGFERKPYCEAHIPKAKATAVKDTPEMKRLAENTKLQSNVQYHADFESSKGKYTQVADDPETLRIKAQSLVISDASYHGEKEKKQIMEAKRQEQQDREKDGPNGQVPQQHRAPQPAPQPVQQHQQPPPVSYQQQPQPTSYQPASPTKSYDSYNTGGGGSGYAPQGRSNAAPANKDSPYSARQASHSHTVYSSRGQEQIPERKPGSIADYDPMGMSEQQYRGASQTSHHHPQQRSAHPQQPQQHYPQHTSPQRSMPASQRTTAYPVSGGGYRETGGHQQQSYGGVPRGYESHQPPSGYGAPPSGYGGYSAVPQQYVPPPGGYGGSPTRRPTQPTNLGRCYRAMYDYAAGDTDEVSFLDGDLIINCTAIDEGWLTGTVQRTGQTGMLPANYVESVN